MSILAFKEQDGTLNVIVTGGVVRDAEIKSGNNGSRVKFSVCYGKKKYMDCEAWADNDVGAVAGCLEKGDIVIAAGTHRTWEYNGKQYSTLSVDFVNPMYSSSEAAPLMQPDEQDSGASGTYSEIDDSDGELPF